MFLDTEMTIGAPYFFKWIALNKNNNNQNSKKRFTDPCEIHVARVKGGGVALRNGIGLWLASVTVTAFCCGACFSIRRSFEIRMVDDARRERSVWKWRWSRTAHTLRDRLWNYTDTNAFLLTKKKMYNGLAEDETPIYDCRHKNYGVQVAVERGAIWLHICLL